MAQKGGGEWYQSIHFDKLVCRKVFFFGPKGTPSPEEHKTSKNPAKFVPVGTFKILRIIA
jgi:hypothetical protein